VVCYPNNAYPACAVGNILIRNCDISYTGLSLTSSANAVVCKNKVDSIICEFNYLHDNISPNQPTGGNGISVENGDITAPNGTDRGHFRYNIICNNRYNGVQVMDGSHDVSFYGNLIFNNGSSGFLVNQVHQTHQKLRIYNNTFFHNCKDATLYVDGDFYFTTDEYDYDVLDLENNIIVTNPTVSSKGYRYCLYTDNALNWTNVKNNIWFKFGVGGGNVAKAGATSYTTATIGSFDSHPYTTFPGFKDSTDLPHAIAGAYGIDMAPNHDGLSLTAFGLDSGARVTGANYSGAINLSGCSGGQTRSGGGAWDLGAYEQLKNIFLINIVR
jgi:hypothetical protein